jgi:hypothetical protein
MVSAGSLLVVSVVLVFLGCCLSVVLVYLVVGLFGRTSKFDGLFMADLTTESVKGFQFFTIFDLHWPEFLKLWIN